MKFIILLIILLSTSFHYSYGGRRGRNKDDDNKDNKDNNKDKEEEDGKDEESNICNFMDNHFTGERGILLIRTPLWGWSNTFDHWRESLLLAGKRSIFYSSVTNLSSNSYLDSSFPFVCFLGCYVRCTV